MFTKFVSASLFCLGLGCLGQGLYMPSKALLAQHLIAKTWHETQETGVTNTPWSWMDAYPVAELTLPNQDAHIVLNTDSGQALAFGPALMTNESFNTDHMIAIAAHKNTQFGSLKNIKAGDVISLNHKTGEHRNFRVTKGRIIDTRTEALLDQGPNSLALVTCYPFDAVSFNGPLRYVIFAERVDIESNDPLS